MKAQKRVREREKEEGKYKRNILQGKENFHYILPTLSLSETHNVFITNMQGKMHY